MKPTVSPYSLPAKSVRSQSFFPNFKTQIPERLSCEGLSGITIADKPVRKVGVVVLPVILTKGINPHIVWLKRCRQWDVTNTFVIRRKA